MSSLSQSSQGKKSSAAKRKHVQVAIRIRPLNEMETGLRARSAIDVCEKSRTIVVKDRNSRKEFGPFDKVYGTESTQLQIYDDIIKPLIHEVLMGYNCTVFAYGQTGTGKTYTIEGTTNPVFGFHWMDNTDSGIIPRAINHIFSEIENQGIEDFSVRVSYVELYNEELYDLLGRSDIQQARLRLYEDPVRKGSVVISALEDVAVRSKSEVLELLQRGAEKRKTAATLMNITSSRSHSVFTVTIVMRENATVGEDLVKQGKLYMVDLAGSENIGRSGAIDIRAREAGNINQSLLTLGRVINALTSGASHIPYRESKLTRILQDSLGGKTITTLIATLSPSSTNLEESCSTLDYATRAKNIKNNPEINQKLSRRGLFKAFNEEIEHLKRDLQAARDKTGIYVDKENYETMQARLAGQAEEIEGLTDRLASTCNVVQKLFGDLSVIDENYVKVYERYKKASGKIGNYVTDINSLRLELADTVSSLQEHKVALEVIENAAKDGHEQASELIKTLISACKKIEYLFGIISSNESELESYECKVNDGIEVCTKCIHEWNGAISDSGLSLTSQCAAVESRVPIQCKESCDMIDEDVRNFDEWIAKRVQEVKMDLMDKLSVYDRDTDFLDKFSKAMEQIHCGYRKHVKTLNDSTEMQLTEMRNHLLAFTNSFEKKSNEGREMVQASMEQYQIEHVEQLGQLLTDLRDEFVNKFNLCSAKLHELSKCRKEQNTEYERTLDSIWLLKNNLNDEVSNDINEITEMKSEFEEKMSELNSLCEETCTDYVSTALSTASDSKRYSEVASHRLQSHLEEKSASMQYNYNALKKKVKVLSNDSTAATTHLSNEVEKLVSESERCSKQVFRSTNNLRNYNEQFVAEYTRPLSSGDTPPRALPTSLTKPVTIPQSSDLINDLKICSSPARPSFIHESLLNSSFLITSPSSLFTARNLNAFNQPTDESVSLSVKTQYF